MKYESKLLDRLHSGMCFSAKDFSLSERDAFLYGIIVGWDGDKDSDYDKEMYANIKENFKELHNWTEEDWRKIEQIREFIKTFESSDAK